MLENIILLKWIKKTTSNSFYHNRSSSTDLSSKNNIDYNDNNKGHLNLEPYMAYPEEGDSFIGLDIFTKISQEFESFFKKPLDFQRFSEDFLHSQIRAIRYDGYNTLTVPLPQKYLLVFLFDKNTNPYDYRNEIIRLLFEYFIHKYQEKNDPMEITNLLLTLFVDLRRYADEALDLSPIPQNPILRMNNIPMIKVFVYGIDNAGKSSLMRLLSTGKFDPDYFPPTKKFRITNINLESGVRMVCWDMPGQKIFRKDWLRGAQSTNIMLFVLDLADQTRFLEAKQELWKILNLYDLKGIPLLFLANKTDLLQNNSELLKKGKVIELFDLDRCVDRNWEIIFSSLPKKKGIDELISWMEYQIDELLMIEESQSSISL